MQRQLLSRENLHRWLSMVDLNSVANIPSRNVGSINQTFSEVLGAAIVATMIGLRHPIDTSPLSVSGASVMLESDIYRIPSEQYESLVRTVDSLRLLPEGENLHIDPESAASGLAFIEYLKEFNVPVPKVFSHGGDALVFTWDLINARRYITTGEHSAVLQEIDAQGASIDDMEVFDLSRPDRVTKMMDLIGGTSWNKPLVR